MALPVTTKKPAAAADAIEPATGAFAALRVRHYPRLWLSGFIWNITRWMSIFLCSYLVNQLTHSPLLVQIVGSAFFAPMFFGGVFAGVISDRFDRRRIVLLLLACLTPVATLMALVNLTGVVRAWMAYPCMLAVGIGMVIDMTSRRALVYDLVGPRLVTNALALESLAMTGGSMLGSLTAGSVIAVLGIGQAFLLIAVLYAVSFWLLSALPADKRPVRNSSSAGILEDLRLGVRSLRGNRALVSILGVTIIMNLFYFSFMTMVPVFADELGVNAFLTGLLASAAAFGSVLGTYLIARGLPIGRGLAYVGGSFIGLLFLFLFAATGLYAVALFALVCAGIGIAGFGTMQSVLVMISADDAMRGRAMGLLSMGIGALPFSMLILGGVAQAVGPATGVMASVVIGLVVLTLWCWRYPESQRLA